MTRIFDLSGDDARLRERLRLGDLEDWYTSKACDGFNISVPTLPRGLEAFVDLVVPELQRRGLFHNDYTGKNLRENIGLPVPTNPYFPAWREAAK